MADVISEKEEEVKMFSVKINLTLVVWDHEKILRMMDLVVIIELFHDDSKLQVTESLDESKGEGGVGGEVSGRPKY